MGRKRTPPPGPAAGSDAQGAAKPDYETKDYPPEKVASVAAGEAASAALPPPPGFGHFTDPGLEAVKAPEASPEVPAPAPPKGIAGPPAFGHFTDPGVIPAKAPVFQLTPYSMEPDTAPTPNLQTLAKEAAPKPESRPQTPLPSYLVSSDGTPLHEPAVRRRHQVGWLLGAAGLIGLSLLFLLRPTTPPTPGSAAAYEMAAKQGDVHAMRTLGAWYTYGLNVKQDPDRGRYWYRKAAEAGDPVAQQELKAIEGR